MDNKKERNKIIDATFDVAENKGEEPIVNEVGEEVCGIQTQSLWKIFCCCCRFVTKYSTNKALEMRNRKKKEENESDGCRGGSKRAADEPNDAEEKEYNAADTKEDNTL